MQNESTPIRDLTATVNNGMSGGYLLLNCAATLVTPITRGVFGSHALGVNGIITCVGLIYFAVAHPPAMIYLAVWLAFLVCRRIATFERMRRRVPIHSKYNGYPWLALRLMPLVKNEVLSKCLVEPVLVAAVGLLVIRWDEPLGWMFLIAASGIYFTSYMDRVCDANALRAMRDASIEQRTLASRFRGQL